MKTTFDDFIQETPKYNKEYFISNMPRYIEFSELWSPAVNKATKSGKTSATFASVMAIYNNLIKKQIPVNEPPKFNPKYNYYKKRFDQISWKDQSRKNFYKSLLTQLKDKGDLSQNQWNHLERLKGH